MSGVAQPFILISEFPSTMIPLRTRIEELGYASFNLTAASEAGLAPPIAVMPFNVQLDLAELQTLLKTTRDDYPGVQIFAVNFGRMKFKLNDAYAAGINFLYSLPFEEELLINKLFETLPPELDAKDISIDQLMRVNVLELETALSLPFNLYLYLPANRKVIHYYHKGSVIDEKRVRKFRENAHYNLYIRRTELKNYKSYCTLVIQSGGETGQVIAENQRNKRTAERLMGLMSGFFNDEDLGEEDAAMSLDSLKGVVEGLETPGASKELVTQVNKIAAKQMTHLTHAQNVAAYCCLFGLAVNAGDPTTLKLGGLLHDLGLADIPLHLIGRDLNEMEEAESDMYKLHPGNAKIMLEERRAKVSQDVLDMVLYHHERPDGSGYPYGRKGDEIPLLAKICAFADEFDKLTSVRANKRQLSPIEAVRRISGLDGQKPSSVYEESVHRPLVDMLLKPRSTSAAQASEAGDTANHGRVQVASAPVVKTSTGGLTVKALLANPKFAGKHTVGLTRETPAYSALWKELDEHWIRRST